jgi:hypothetical protein
MSKTWCPEAWTACPSHPDQHRHRSLTHLSEVRPGTTRARPDAPFPPRFFVGMTWGIALAIPLWIGFVALFSLS